MAASQELQGQTRNMALLIDGDNALLHAYHTTSGWFSDRVINLERQFIQVADQLII